MATKTTQSFDLYLDTLFELYESTSYSETRKSLELALDKITNKLIKESDVTEWSKSKLNEYKKLIDEEIGNSYSDVFQKVADESVAVAGVTAGAYGLNKLPTRTINDLINSKRQIQGYDFGELFRVTEENQKRALRTLLASEVAMGTPPTKIAKMLQEKGSSLTRSQLNTSVFTTLSESREQARYEAYKELEKEIPLKYEYVATLDSRVSEYCLSHDGKIYDTLEEIQQDLNSHFNCRSTKASVADENDIPSTRASMFGETQNLPYKDWVKTLNDEQLRIILGRKYNAYKNGTYQIKSLADVKQAGVKLGLNDIKKEIKKPVVQNAISEINIKEVKSKTITNADILEDGKIIGKGNTGNVYLKDGKVYKRYTEPEMDAYNLMKSESGIINAKKAGDFIETDFYKVVITPETLRDMKDSAKKQISSLVQESREEITKTINILSNKGISYSDKLQFIYDKNDKKVKLFDLSNAIITKDATIEQLRNIRNENFEHLSKFYESVDLKDNARRISNARVIKNASEDDLSWLVDSDVKKVVTTKNDIEIISQKIISDIGEKQKRAVYFQRDARDIDYGMKNSIVLDEDKGKYIVFDKKLTADKIKEFELEEMIYE